MIALPTNQKFAEADALIVVESAEKLPSRTPTMLTKDSRDRGRRMLADKQGAKAIAALISEAEGRTVTAKEIEALAPPKGVRSNHPPPRSRAWRWRRRRGGGVVAA